MIVKGRKRLPGWAHRVRAELDAMDPALYEFGKRDCFQTFMAVERAMYGASLWEKRYSKYSSHDEAKEKLRSRVRTRNPAAFLDRVYRRVPVEKIKFGDIAVEIFGFGLPHIYLFNGEKMVTYLPPRGFGVRVHHLTHFNHYWRI